MEVKVKLSLCCEDVLGSGGIAPHIIDLSTRWRCVVSFMPWPLHPQGKSPWYPLDRRLCGPQNRSGNGEEKNSQPLPGLRPLIIQSIAQHYTTELSWLPIIWRVAANVLISSCTQTTMGDFQLMDGGFFMVRP
jgi:hypothetical protein